MGSTFGGLEIGKRGLVAHQTALTTTGHNISNADNPNYARQRVSMEAMTPLYDPSLNRAAGPGQIGQGVNVASIERIRDSFYDDQIVEGENVKSFSETSHNYLSQMEKIFLEPSENSLRSLSDNFWASMQELANFPTEQAHREVVTERARGLTAAIRDTHGKLQQLRIRADNEILTTVDQVNSLAGDIRELNEKILKLQTLGDNPNDLMDRRDAAVEKLSGFVDINVGRGDKDELIVFIGEQALVQGEIQRKLKVEADPANEGMHRIAWEHNDRDLILGGGKLYGLLDMRDRAIQERISQVNLFAVNMTDIVNEIHRDGFGLDGSTNKDFFTLRNLSSRTDGLYATQNESGNFDLNQDGIDEITALFRVTGTNTVDPKNRIGVEGTLTFYKNDRENAPVNVEYSRDDTLEAVIKRINDNQAGVVAYMNHDNQLALKSTVASDDVRRNFMIRHMEDSGELLVGYTGILNSSGPGGAFDYNRINEISKLRAPLQDITLTPLYHPAAQIRVADAIINNPQAIAAGRGADIGGTGDYNRASGEANGNNALLIAAALKQKDSMIGHAANVEEYYSGLVAKLGTETRTAQEAVTRQTENLLSLNNLRQSIMGVNLDEEISNMVQFQQSYNASARIINTMNEMIDTIIHRLGA